MSAREIRLRHAKRLAIVARGAGECAALDDMSTETNTTFSTSIPRQQRSARLVSGSDSVIYSMVLEQCRALAIALQKAAPRISKACSLWSDIRRADEIALLEAAIAEIELCLGHHFGGGHCCSYIGLLDPGAQSLTYVAASQESDMKGRNIRMDQSVALQCIQRSETIIIDSLDTANQLGVRTFGTRTVFPCICTPLRAQTGRPIGILTVDGLCSNATPLCAGVAVACFGAKEDNTAKRTAELVDYYKRLKPFAEKNDEGCKRIKLWKVQDKNTKDASIVAARVVCGHVVGIDRSRGIGSIYSVRWEDGRCETEISFRTIKEMLRSTPASLGVGIPCDAALVGFVEYAGRAIGELLIRLRVTTHINSVTKVPELANSGHGDLFKQSLQSAMNCILGAQSAEIWEYDEQQRICVVAHIGRTHVFRQMCIPRRLLEIPGHERHNFWRYVASSKSFAMPHANETLVAPLRNCAEITRKGRLLVVTCSPGTFDSKDIMFLDGLAEATSGVIGRLSLRERQAHVQLQTLQHVSLFCTNSMNTASRIEAGVLRKIRGCLVPSSRIHFGLLKIGGDEINMRGYDEYRTLKSCMFECLPPVFRSSFVVHNPYYRAKSLCTQPGARVQVKYGKLWYLATVKADRGHLKYDIVYDHKDWMGRRELEAGVSITRLREAVIECQSLSTPGASDSDPQLWPILIVPLGCYRGVICVDSWLNGTAKSDQEQCLITNFLKSVGACLGTAIDDKVRGHFLRYMWTSAKGAKVSCEEIKQSFVSIVLECTLFLDHIRLKDATLEVSDLSGLEYKTASELLDRCQDISLATQGRTTFLIQAPVPNIAFLSLFKDSEVVNGSNGPTISRSRLAAFCSSITYSVTPYYSNFKNMPIARRLKYDVDGWEDVAFFSKLSELTETALADIISLECNNLTRHNAIEAVRCLCNGCSPLVCILEEAIGHISSAVMPMNVQVRYITPSGGALGLAYPFNEAIQTTNTQFEISTLRTAVNGQPLIVLPAKSNVTSCLCFPMVCDSRTARGVVNIVNHIESNLTPNMINFLETASALLGTAVDEQCKASEILVLNAARSDLDQYPISIRAIYRNCLGALYRQLVYSCRVSIWQLRPTSRCPTGGNSEGRGSTNGLSLSLKIIFARGLPLQRLKCVTAVFKIGGVQVGRVYSSKVDESLCEFDAKPVEVPLGENWLSSSIRIELWPGNLQNTDAEFAPNLLGFLELQGGHYLYLPSYTTAYKLVGGSFGIQPAELSVDSRLGTMKNILDTSEGVTGLSREGATLLLIQASVTKGLHSPNHYVCVFYDEARSEFGRSSISGYTLFPTWNKLSIPIRVGKRASAIHIDLVSMSADSPHVVIASTEVPCRLHAHLPRNKLDLCLRMRLSDKFLETPETNSCRGVEKKSSHGVELVIRLEKLCQYEPRRDASHRHDLQLSAISVSRLLDGAIEFNEAPVGADSGLINCVASACHEDIPYHFKNESQALDCFVVPFADMAIRIGDQVVGPLRGTNFAVVVPGVLGCSSLETLWFIRDVVRITENTLRFSRQQELRDVVRAHASAQITATCDSWAEYELPEIIDDVLHVSCLCLPSCCIYLSLLQPGGDELVYVACNAQSEMCGEYLARGKGVSFDCIGYNRLFVATQETEVRVYRQYPSLMPFICIPIGHNGSTLGVLAVDTIGYVCRARKGPGPVPEDGILQFLGNVGSHVGRAIDLRRKADALVKLEKARIISSPQDMCRLALHAICCNVFSITACEVWQIDSKWQVHAIARLPTEINDLESAWESASAQTPVNSLAASELQTCIRNHGLDSIAMGRLLHAALYSRHLDIHLVGKRPRRLAVPLAGLAIPHMLLLELRKNCHLCSATKSYVMAVAKALRESLLTTI